MAMRKQMRQILLAVGLLSGTINAFSFCNIGPLSCSKKSLQLGKTSLVQEKQLFTFEDAAEKGALKTTPVMLFGFGGSGRKKSQVPKDYNALHQQAISAVQAGLKKGERRLEVEFPPLPSLNKLGDGSRKSAQQALQANAEFTQKLSKALAQKTKTVWILCYEAGLKSALGDLGGKVQIKSSRDKLVEQEFGSGDILVAIGPSDESQWKKTAALSEILPVVVVNGVFNNGYYLYEPVYYFRPLSGRGYLIRQYPDEFKVYTAQGPSKPLPVKIPFLEQGNFRRPDTRVAISALDTEEAANKK